MGSAVTQRFLCRMVLVGSGVFFGFGMGAVCAQNEPTIVYNSMPVVVHDPAGCHDMLPNALASCSPSVCVADVFAVRYKCLVSKNDKTCEEIKRELFQRNTSIIVGPQPDGRCYFTSRIDNDTLNKHEVVADCRLKLADLPSWASALSEWQEGQLKIIQKQEDKLDTFHLSAKDVEANYMLPCIGQVLMARTAQELTGSADLTLLQNSPKLNAADAIPIALGLAFSCQGSAVSAGLSGVTSDAFPQLPPDGGQAPGAGSGMSEDGSGASGGGSCVELPEKLGACQSYTCHHLNSDLKNTKETVTGVKLDGACGFTSDATNGATLICALATATKVGLATAASGLSVSQVGPFEDVLKQAIHTGECLEL